MEVLFCAIYSLQFNKPQNTYLLQCESVSLFQLNITSNIQGFIKNYIAV